MKVIFFNFQLSTFNFQLSTLSPLLYYNSLYTKSKSFNKYQYKANYILCYEYISKILTPVIGKGGQYVEKQIFINAVQGF